MPRLSTFLLSADPYPHLVPISATHPGAIAHAEHKADPGTRHRRIRTLEKDLRKREHDHKTSQVFLKLWSAPSLTPEQALAIAGRDDRGYRLYSELRNHKITAEQAVQRARRSHEHLIAYEERWIEHLHHRLMYEKAMLAQDVGESFEEKFKDLEQGGRVLVGDEWSVVLRVNRQGGKILSVRTNGLRHSLVGIEMIKQYEPPDEGIAEVVKAAIKSAPIVNFPGSDFEHMTKAEWDRRRKDNESYYYSRIKATDKTGAYRQRVGPARNFRQVSIYLSDQPRVDPPGPQAADPRLKARERLAEERERVPALTPQPALPREHTAFDDMKAALSKGFPENGSSSGCASGVEPPTGTSRCPMAISGQRRREVWLSY